MDGCLKFNNDFFLVIGYSYDIKTLIQSKILQLDKNQFQCADCDHTSICKSNMVKNVEDIAVISVEKSAPPKMPSLLIFPESIEIPNKSSCFSGIQ